MKAFIVLLALLLAACGPRLSTAQKDKIDATQAVVDEQVRAGKMTEAEGRLVVARAKAEADAEWRRNYAIMTSGGDGPATYQPVGGGTVVRY